MLLYDFIKKELKYFCLSKFFEISSWKCYFV